MYFVLTMTTLIVINFIAVCITQSGETERNLRFKECSYANEPVKGLIAVRLLSLIRCDFE